MAGRVAGALAAAARRLEAAGVENAQREAAWLLAHALGERVSDLRLRGDRPLDDAAAAAFDALVSRRARREPLQYILGTQEFMGMTFAVTPDVLIPRPDTEVLVRAVAAELTRRFPGAGAYRMADIGTGSGCIAVGLCHLLPGAQVAATDVSAGALAVAAHNAGRLGYADRIRFCQGDLYAPLAGLPARHAIVSNPPYIAADEWDTLMPEVREYEPRIALTPGGDGLAVISRLISDARPHLVPGGVLALEVGYRQAALVAEWMERHGLVATAIRDPAGHLRCVIGVASGAG